MAVVGREAWLLILMSLPERDSDLEYDFPGLRIPGSYLLSSPIDPQYNCIAFALGDVKNFWYDVKVNGYYWPPGAPSADTLEGWLKVFGDHGYVETQDSGFESDFEKIAIYGTDKVPEHVARQKASGVWISKMGTSYDIEHPSLEALDGGIAGTVVKIMKRRCKDGRRVLE